ncbi:MAG TPA: hypothetical protein VL172_19045, partial [Kofleriaceae bacterium]|nr:hypothetical protein [Kofleriaceae bacterium]
LRGPLDDARTAAAPAAPAAPSAATARADGEDEAGAAGPAGALLRGLSRMTDRDRPELPRETRQERRLRWQKRIADMLGRRPGESEQAYRDRVTPFISVGLAKPRADIADARKAAEAAAGITPEQRAQIDTIVAETQQDLIELTNQAVAQGQLTPYERNWTGLLEHAGTLGGVLGSTEQRLSGVLSAAQRKTVYDLGFEWGEYIGVTTHWEDLDPPPPPKGGDG